jgi:hypothetical protein
LSLFTVIASLVVVTCKEKFKSFWHWIYFA